MKTPAQGHLKDRATCKRRAPDIEGLHASLEDVIGLRRFSLRGLTLVTASSCSPDR
jgi:hypothetical protein